MAGWITCNFTFFSTVFQSYQDDGRVIMKDCVQWNPDCEDFQIQGVLLQANQRPFIQELIVYKQNIETSSYFLMMTPLY